MSTIKPIYVTSPSLPPLEEFIPYLEKIWASHWLTNNGQFHQQFEAALAEYLGVKYVSFFTNGMIALQAGLHALRITGEVITTPFTFVATTHAIHLHGCTPVFCDIEPETFTLDPDKVEALITPRTTAILPVHVYGNPCKNERLQKIADTYGLKLFYDAAHVFGVQKNGCPVVSWGDLSMLSFHATKVFNTLEGGALVTDDPVLKKRIDFLRNFGFQDEVTVVAPGMNGKVDEVRSAYGLLQLKYVDANCPACGEKEAETVASKKLMKLVRCTNCSLLYRTPTDRAASNRKFYQKMYVEGGTTEMPSANELEKMKKTNFESIQKNFPHWIRLVKGYKVSGQLLDYGCSWGYGAWQFARAGYDVEGFEISRPRGQYAIKEMGINVVFQESDLPDDTYDIVFSSHVIEHVPNPVNMIKTITRILKPGGLFLGLTPNGAMEFKLKDLTGWMSAWGRKHAVYLDDIFMQKALIEIPYLITSELTVNKLGKWLVDSKSCVCDLEKSELVFIFKKP